MMLPSRIAAATPKTLLSSQLVNTGINLTSSERRRLVVLAICFTVVIASIPIFTSHILRVYPHDLVFHLYRIDGIAQGLREGQLPVRIQSTQISGLGYPVSVCYGDLFLYFPALLRLLGLSMRASYALFIVVVNAFCAIVTYVTCKRMFRSYSVALMGCVLWTLSPYRLLIDVWLRAAVSLWRAAAIAAIL